MRNIRIFFIFISLLGLFAVRSHAQNLVHGPLMLNGQEIEAEYLLVVDYACLGSGYNSCIPQYSEGKVEVPATITIDGYEYPVNEISNLAFRMCSKITEVILPVNVYGIGSFAFQGCQSLTYVSLPSTLADIGTGAFIDLPKLCQIDIHAEYPPEWLYNDVFRFHTGGIGDNAIYTYDDVLLCVPEGKVDTYRNKTYYRPEIGWTTREGWGNFTNITITASENAEAYATYHNGILTFYYDTHRIDRERSGYAVYGIAPNDYFMGFPGWLVPVNGHANDITQVVFTALFKYARPTTMAKWFNNCVNLDTIIGLDNLNTEAVTDMSFMFYKCSGLQDDDLDFSGFNTSAVTTMQSMFQECTGLHQPDLSHFDTRHCTSMENMFWGCTGLTSMDLSMFETTACNFNYMFYNCANLEEVNIGSFGVNDNYICNEMFGNCGKLTTLVVPSAFDKLNQAFKGCTSMKDVYCYKPNPFDVWQRCDIDFNVNNSKYTKFHVLAETYNDWVTAYGEGSTTPANVTFVGDLGTDENPILLYGNPDWMNLRQIVDRDLNINAKMMNDFTVTTMLGTIFHPFKGTFDGNGHTLTLDYEITQNTASDNHDIIIAPFSIIQNAEIKNLAVKGDITVAANTERIGAAGLVGYCANLSNTEETHNLITNCHVSTNILGNIESLGGIVNAVTENVVTTMSGCLFDGSLAAHHDYYLLHTIWAGAMACAVNHPNNISISNCVENGSYENVSHKSFCATANEISGNSSQHVFPVNSYYLSSELEGIAKHGYSLTTDTEGLVLDFGTPTATYDVSGITAFGIGLKIDEVFHVESGQMISVTITAPGYENIQVPNISGGGSLSTTDMVHFNVTLASDNAVISMPSIIFTTILLYDDAQDNSLTLENYVDQTYKVQLVGHTLRKDWQWNPICLPFDLSRSELENSPLAGARLKVLDTITFNNKVAVYHFKDTTAFTANKPYLVKVNNNIVDPVFNNVKIKRSLPPGMKTDVGDNTLSGFSVEGNYNSCRIEDICNVEHFYTALYFDGTSLRPVRMATVLNAFRFFFEVCVDPSIIVAAVLDIEGGANSLAILDDRYSDVNDIFFHDGNWDEYENWAKETIPNLSSKVLIESDAVIPAEYVAQAGEIVIDEGSIFIKDGGQLVHNNWGVHATVEKIFEPYPTYLEKAGYYLITNPVVEAQDPEYLNNMTQDYGNSAYDLYYFDQSESLEWRNYKQNHFDLENGIGYLYASQSTRFIEYKGMVNPANTDINIPVTYDDNAYFAGFNLVGNPFVCNAYMADGRDFYVLNEAGDEVVTAMDDAIAPMQGVFVLATDDESTVGFTTDQAQAQAPQAPQRGGVVLNVSKAPQAQAPKRGDVVIDRAIVRFGEGMESQSRNLPKFQLRKNSTKVYFTQDDKDYAVMNAEAQGEIPVNFKAEKNGTYTLTVSTLHSQLSTLHLIDHLTGIDIDLLKTPSYTFDAKVTDYASRFKLVFSAGEDNHDNNDSFAYFSNGDLIVNGTGTLQVIDMLGRILLSRQTLSDFCLPSSAFLPPGVYVLRLINGDDVKTQKITKTH